MICRLLLTMELRGIWPCSVFFFLSVRKTACYVYKLFDVMLQWECFFFRCGVCSQIFPAFEELSNSFKGMKFVYADIDECPETTRHIRYTPTFQFYRNGEKVDEMFGTGEERLRDRLWLHSWKSSCVYEICNTFVNSILSFHFGKSFSGITYSLVT